jgi:hypothetical protein
VALAVVVALVAALITQVAGAGSASAGASHPPLTNGYVNWDAGIATLGCSGSTPTSLAYSVDWDATGLHGSYPIEAELWVVAPDGQSDGSLVAAASVTAGQTGTYTHTFALPTIPTGDTYQVYINSSPDPGTYEYTHDTGSFDCAQPAAHPTGEPTVTMTPLTCGDDATITLDGTHVTSNWGWTVLAQQGGFIPGQQQVTPGQSVTVPIQGVNPAVTPYLVVRVETDGVGSDVASFELVEPADCPQGDAYTPLATPGRVANTATGVGIPGQPVAGGASVGFAVAGHGGVPATGVSAVVATVTVEAPAASGSVTVWPDGSARPGAASLSFFKGLTAQASVTVRLPADGKLDLRNNTGVALGLIVDIYGYFGSAPSPGGYVPLDAPVRVANTASGAGFGVTGPRAPGSISLFTVSGVPAAATAIVATVTVENPSTSGSITMWPDDVAQPGAASLSFFKGLTAQASLTIRQSDDAEFELRNNTAVPLGLIVDVYGYYTAGGSAGRYVPLSTPGRVANTATGAGIAKQQVAPGQSVSFQVAGQDGIAASGISSVDATVTVEGPGTSGSVTMWPDGTIRPGAASLSFFKGLTAQAAITVRIPVDGKLELRNNTTVPLGLIVDVYGYFASTAAAG